MISPPLFALTEETPANTQPSGEWSTMLVNADRLTILPAPFCCNMYRTPGLLSRKRDETQTPLD